MLTDGAGGILGRGSALSWSQLETMVADARADARGAADPARTTAAARRAVGGRAGLGGDRARTPQPVSRRPRASPTIRTADAVLLPAFVLVAIAGAVRAAWSP